MRRAVPAQERLLSSATLAFARTGFEGASTHSIARSAGAPQGLIRHHFGSKEGLWLAVVERGLAQVEAELEELPLGMTVDAWVAIVERHSALGAVLLHALLEGGPRAELAADRGTLVARQLRELQQRAQPYADEAMLPMWLLASAAIPLMRLAAGEAAPRVTRSQQVDRLFAWLCGATPQRAPGPFALHAARSRLRGTS